MSDDPREDWMPLTEAARRVNRNPRVLRRWAAEEGMLTRIIGGIVHVKLRHVHSWSAEKERRPPKRPETGGVSQVDQVRRE